MYKITVSYKFYYLIIWIWIAPYL